MPLFQPSNITPSSFAGVGGGTVAVLDNVKITWQVNGNMAMTAYKIDIFNTNNTLIYTSGILTDNTPFYPTDNKGNPQYFSYEPNVSWGNCGLADGNEYTLQITQYWGGFTDNDHAVIQFSQSAFITRTTPSIAITTLSGETNFSTISSIFQDFTAVYTQAQNDSIDWVRWQLYQVKSGKEVLLDDTKAVNTQVLSYRANNMISGYTYKIVCSIQTENGVQAKTNNEFSVLYEFPVLEGNVQFNCLDKTSNLLKWDELQENVGDDIKGVSNNGNYSFDNGNLVLPKDSTITWNKKNDGNLSIPANWTLFWEGSVDFAANYTRTAGKVDIDGKGIEGAVFSPDGKQLSLFGYSRVVPCSVTESRILSLDSQTFSSSVNTVSYCKDGTRFVGGHFGAVYNSKSITTSTVYSSAFNGDYGNVLALGLKNAVKFSRISNNNAGALFGGTEGDFGEIKHIAFTPDGDYLIAASSTNIIYFYGDGVASYPQYSYAGKILDGGITDGGLTFSKTGQYLICGTGVYTVSEGIKKISLTQIGSISENYNACFTPDEKFIISCDADRNADLRIYEIKNNTVQYVGGVYALGTSCDCVACSPNGNLVFVGGGLSSASTKYFFATNGSQSIISAGNISVNANNKVNFDVSGYTFSFSVGGENDLILTLLDSYVKEFSFSVNKSSVKFLYSGATQSKTINYSTYPQSAITSIVLSGGQTCAYLYITSGTSTISNNFNPVWDSNTKFLTHFESSSLQAGQLEVSENAMDIYRETVSTGAVTKLYSCSAEMTYLKDFSWRAGNQYNYYGYARLDNAYTATKLFNESVVCRNQPYYLLLATTQDEEQPNVYHVVHYWRFGNNVEAGSVSNNNAPTFLNNFTGYRLKQPTARKGKSGTLTALLSNVANNKYKDTTLQMDNLYALSECNNPLFLKDMKGNIYMVTVSAPITQTINTKSAHQEVRISIPWEEIGAAENVSIIEVPMENGGSVDNDVQISEVRLVVDDETGMLKVIYPDEYNYALTFEFEDPQLYAVMDSSIEGTDIELVNGAVILNENNEG